MNWFVINLIHSILHSAVHTYVFHIFITSLSSFHGFITSQPTTSSQLACQLNWQSAPPVSERSRVRTRTSLIFFSGFLFATAKVSYITAMIILHLILHAAVHIYVFNIFITSDKFDSGHNVMTQAKFRRICMESSEHNWANISETICPTMPVFGKQASWMLFFQAILTNPIISNFNFYNVITLALCLGHHNTYTKRFYFIEFSPVQHQYPVLILPLLF